MPGIHVLTGANAPEKEKALKSVLARELPKDRAAQNFEVYHAAEVPVNEIGNALSTGSLFGSASVILLRDCQEMNSGSLEELAPYIDAMAPGNTLIMEGLSLGKVGKTHPVWQALNRAGPQAKTQEFPLPKPWEMGAWAAEQCRSRFGRGLEKGGAELLLEIVGESPGAIVQELQKIDLALPPRQPVTQEAIRRYASSMRRHTPWELQEPVGHKALARALSILKNLFDFNKPQAVALPLLSTLFGHFTALLKLRLYFDKRPEARDRALRARIDPNRFHPCPELADIANDSNCLGRPLTPYSAYPIMGKSKLAVQAGNFTVEQFNYILRLLATADEDLKSGGLWQPDFGSLSRLITFIVLCDRFRTSTRYD